MLGGARERFWSSWEGIVNFIMGAKHSSIISCKTSLRSGSSLGCV